MESIGMYSPLSMPQTVFYPRKDMDYHFISGYVALSHDKENHHPLKYCESHQLSTLIEPLGPKSLFHLPKTNLVVSKY